MNKPQYFIRIDTYWQDSDDYFVGPFDTRQDAQSEIDSALERDSASVYLSNWMAGDVRHGIRVHGVLTATEAKRMKLNTNSFQEQGNLIGITIPNTSDDMFAIVRMDY